MVLEYSVVGRSDSRGKAEIAAKSNLYDFGIKADQSQKAGPAEILMSAFAACCLKNVERFSEILKYSYDSAEIEVTGIRQETPPMITHIRFKLHINSKDPNLKPDLLLKNLQKFGTIYNTLNAACQIKGEIIINNHV